MSQTKVLVVEDEKIVAKEIEVRLKKLGYEVSASVQTGEASIQKVKKLDPFLHVGRVKNSRQ